MARLQETIKLVQERINRQEEMIQNLSNISRIEGQEVHALLEG